MTVFRDVGIFGQMKVGYCINGDHERKNRKYNSKLNAFTYSNNDVWLGFY